MPQLFFFFATPPDDLARLATPPDDRLPLLLALPDDLAGGLDRETEPELDRAGAGLADPLERVAPALLDDREGTARETPAELGRVDCVRDVLPDDLDGCGTTRVLPLDERVDGTARVDCDD